MKARPKTALLFSLALTAMAGLTASAASEKAPLTSREKAVHVLNRLGFGPRPGDVERVLETGISAYIEGQLAPERIPDHRRLVAPTTLPHQPAPFGIG